MAIRKSSENKIEFKVLEECGTLSTNANGWELKLRYMSWNGKDAKYDLRSWKEDKCSKGITFTGEELESLLGILKKMESEE